MGITNLHDYLYATAMFSLQFCVSERRSFSYRGKTVKSAKQTSFIFSSEGHPAKHSKNLRSLLKIQGLFGSDFGLHVVLTLVVP